MRACPYARRDWCFPAGEARLLAGSYITRYKSSFLSSPVTLGVERRVSALTRELKRIKSVSVSAGDHVCSLIFLPNRCGSLPDTARYARSVTSSLWMIHGYKLPPTGMSRGGEQRICRAINLRTFNGMFS